MHQKNFWPCRVKRPISIFWNSAVNGRPRYEAPGIKIVFVGFIPRSLLQRSIVYSGILNFYIYKANLPNRILSSLYFTRWKKRYVQSASSIAFSHVQNITNRHWVESPISQSEHNTQMGSVVRRLRKHVCVSSKTWLRHVLFHLKQFLVCYFANMVYKACITKKTIKFLIYTLLLSFNI